MRERHLARAAAASRRRPGPPSRSCGAGRGTGAARRAAGSQGGRRRSRSAAPPSPRGRPRGGRIDGSRRAASDLPAPGGPTISRLWPPAAATSSASAQVRAGRAGRRGRAPGPAPFGARPAVGGRRRLASAAQRPPTARAARAGSPVAPPASAASGPFAAGTAIACAPSPPAASAIASAPGTGRIEPSRASSPASATPLEPLGRKLARRRRGAPAAIARSKPGPGLAQVGRGEVRGDPLLRELEAGVHERRAHPLARLAHRRVGQARPARRSAARAAHVDLDADLPRLDPEQRESTARGEHTGERYGPSFRGWYARCAGTELKCRLSR